MITPLSTVELLRYPLPPGSRYTRQELYSLAAMGMVACWVRQGKNGYLIAAPWRRRTEILTIMECTGDGWTGLIDDWLALCERNGVSEVLLDYMEADARLRAYADRGFSCVDELVQLEASNLRIPSLGPRSTVEIAAGNDLPSILDVDHTAFDWLWQNSMSELEWYASSPDVVIYVQRRVGSEQSKIIGYAGLTIQDDRAHLDRLAVSEEHQRQGLGHDLLQQVMELSAQQGSRRMALSTQASNIKARRLYTKLGFRPTGWRAKLYGLRLGDASQTAQKQGES